MNKLDFLEPSPHAADCGHLIGRDPRTIEIGALATLGHTSPIKAIRAKCLDCCGDNAAEARKCVAVECPLWAFRMGRNLFRGKASTDTSTELEPHQSRTSSEERAQ